MSNKNSLSQLGDSSRKDLTSSMLGEFPGLGSLVSSVQHWIHSNQLKALSKFLNVAEIDEKYLLSLATDEKKQELFIEYAQAASKTHNTIGCVCLALIFKDKEIDVNDKIISTQSLNNISSNATDFLINPIVRKTFENTSTSDAINMEDYTSTELQAVSVSTELINRNICARTDILGDIGMHIRVTGYTFFIHEYLLKAQSYINSNDK